MWRVLIVTFWVFLFQIFVQALPLVISVQFLPFIVGPALVLYASFYLPPVEAASAVLLGGMTIDALSGFPLGATGLLLLVVWFLTSWAIDALGKPTGLLLFGVGFCVSFGSRLLWLVGLVMFSRGRANFLWSDFLWVPIGDALIAVVFASTVEKCFIWFRLSEPEPMNFMSERG